MSTAHNIILQVVHMRMVRSLEIWLCKSAHIKMWSVHPWKKPWSLSLLAGKSKQMFLSTLMKLQSSWGTSRMQQPNKEPHSPVRNWVATWERSALIWALYRCDGNDLAGGNVWRPVRKTGRKRNSWNSAEMTRTHCYVWKKFSEMCCCM